MSDRLRNLLLGLGAVVVLGLGYMVFINNSGGDDLLSSSGGSAEATLQTQEFLTRLRSIQNLDVSTELLAEDRFRSLIDLRQRLPEEPVGRTNPFEPL